MREKTVSDLEEKLAVFFRFFPRLPFNIKNLVVDSAPYLAISVGGIILLLTGVNLWRPKTNAVFIFNHYLQIVFNLLTATILFLSFKPLINRQLKGWQTLLYLTLIQLPLFIFTVNLGGLILSLLTFYLLFQIKEHYY